MNATLFRTVYSVLLLSANVMLVSCATPPADKPRVLRVPPAKQAPTEGKKTAEPEITAPASPRDDGVQTWGEPEKPRAVTGRKATQEPAPQVKVSAAERKARVAAIDKNIAKLHAEIDRLLLRYTPRYPEVLLRKRELRDLNRERKTLAKGLPKLPAVAPVTDIYVSEDSQPGSRTSGPWKPKILQPETTHYLPDFSYAGYRWGEEPIPHAQGRQFRVSDFGAVAGDGKDDTDAILSALEAAHKHEGPVVVSFPRGRFIVTQLISINRGNIVLKGAGGRGKQGTQLMFPKPILAVDLPPKMDLLRQQRQSERRRGIDGWRSPANSTGGFIWVEKEAESEKLLVNVKTASQGSHRLLLAEGGHKFHPGMVVNLGWCQRGCDKSTFLNQVFDGQAVTIGEKTKKNETRALVEQALTIVRVDGNSLTIKEGLLHDIRPEWKVTVSSKGFLKQVGIEGLRLVFPKTPYQGHGKEAGYNGIFLRDLLHSWVRDVAIINADNGVLMRSCKNVSLENVTLTGRGGHYGIKMVNSNHVLVKDFVITARPIHSLSVSTGARFNVFTDGRIHEARLDQHHGLNQQNLFDNLRVKMKNIGQLFHHGGSPQRLPTAGAFSTFWNIDVNFDRHSASSVSDAPSARIVGLRGSKPITLGYGPNAYVEGLGRSGITVPSLYQYQLSARGR